MSIWKNGKLIAGGRQVTPLLSFMWADHILDDISWLRADTFSWHTGNKTTGMYPAAYQHLTDDCEVAYAYRNSNNTVCWLRTRTPQVGDSVYNNWQYTTDPVATIATYDESTQTITLSGWRTGTFTRFPYSDKLGVMSSETIGGTTIQFYLADDGHKICPASEESNVAAIYTATGVAWYYILDTANQRFKLPRSKHNKYANYLGIVGNGQGLGLTANNTTIRYPVNFAANNDDGSFSSTTGSTAIGSVIAGQDTGNKNQILGVATDPTKSGIIAQQEQDTDQYKYLYFYVGAFTQTALENTAGITAETLNDKVDKGHQVIEFQAPTAANNYTWYRKYADGWVEQGGQIAVSGDNVAVTLPVEMADANYPVVGGVLDASAANGWRYANRTTTGFTKMLVGNVNCGGSWQVNGMAAS